jgi:PAS domain S-box-containing protein
VSTAVAHDLVQKSLVGEALDAGPVAVFVADDDGKFLAVNACACELLGYEREALLALRVPDVTADDAAAAHFEAMLQTGKRDGTARLRCKDGTAVELHFRASATTIGGMALYVGVFWPADDAA